MKIYSKFFSMALVAIASLCAVSTSNADPIPNAAFDMVTAIDQGGFGFGVTGYGGPFTFDGVAEIMGTDPSGGEVSINEVNIENGDGTCTLQFTMTTTGTDIFPAVDGAGTAIDNAGWFMGSSLGGTDLAFEGGPPTLTDNGQGAAGIAMGIFGFDAAGANTWGFRLFNDGDVWDGSGGFNLGATPLGVGTTTILLEVNYIHPVPEPGTMGMISVVALGMFVRRRR